MAVVTCSACGLEQPAGSEACAACGRTLPRPCVRCHFANRPRSNFCSNCGLPLRREAKDVAEPARRASPESGRPPASFRSPGADTGPRAYTPKHLVVKILGSRAALEGERKQVTVLFVDVKGSMRLAERVDAEDWHRVLDRFFAILADGIHRFEGTINQFTGDGVMALFGAPIAHEDHAQRACHAALHLREQVRVYAQDLKRSRGIAFAVRMGLNSGEVVVGRIGDDLRMDYTAQGHTVGLAARTQQIAKAGEVFLTAHTAALVSSFFELAEVGRIRIKGVRAPVRTFALGEARPIRTRIQASRAHGFSRFVGRGDEVARLEAALSRAVSGYGQVVGVVGPPGVGKSRLCLEVVERWRTQGLAVAEAHCPPHARSLPYVTLVDLMRSFFAIKSEDRPAVNRRRARSRLRQLGRGLETSLPVLLDVLGCADPRRPSPPVDAATRREQILVLLRRLVQTQSAEQPTVLLIDDAHWIDRESDAVLADLVDAVGWTRTLLLLNFRPGYEAEWMTASYYQPVHLSPLAPAAADALLCELIGEDSSVTAVRGAIQDRAEGNPFFLEEVVKSLVDQGVLVREGAGRRRREPADRVPVRLVLPAAEIRIPPTVQAVLTARIDGLPEPAKQVLLAAAVIGKRFSGTILRPILEVESQRTQPPGVAAPPWRGDAADLASALGALERAELIRADPQAGDGGYAFKHTLTQEVAYHSQLQETRARRHEAVARALEAAHANRLGEHAALLAHHWEAAGRAYTARVWRRRAGLRVTRIEIRRGTGRSQPPEPLARGPATDSK